MLVLIKLQLKWLSFNNNFQFKLSEPNKIVVNTEKIEVMIIIRNGIKVNVSIIMIVQLKMEGHGVEIKKMKTKKFNKETKMMIV